MVSLDVPLFCIFISAGIRRNYSCIFLLELLFLPLKELVQGRGIYLMVVGGGAGCGGVVPLLSPSVCLECVLCIWEGLSLASFFPVCSLYIFFFFYEMTCSSRMLFEKQKGKKVRSGKDHVVLYCLLHCLFPRGI